MIFKICEHNNRIIAEKTKTLLSIELKNKTYSIILDKWNGKKILFKVSIRIKCGTKSCTRVLFNMNK